MGKPSVTTSMVRRPGRSLGAVSISDGGVQRELQCANHIAGTQYLLTGANLLLYNAASHRGAPGRLSGSVSLFVDTGFIPSYNGERGL